MAEHNVTGERGEALACEYLEKKGYEILETNWRWHKSELDIIAKDGEWLVFVEVKTRGLGYVADPTDALTRKKQKLLIRGADAYVEQTGIDLECRYDVITVIMSEKSAIIRQISSAFFPVP